MTTAIRLQDAVTHYLDRRSRRVAKGTFVNDQSLVLRFQAFVGGNPWMSTITAGMVDDFFYSGAPNAFPLTNKANTFNVAVGRLGHFISYTRKHGWLSVDVMDEVIRRPKVELIHRRFTATEMLRLCAAPQYPQEKMLVTLACNTALRIADITSLRFSPLDENGKLDTATRTIDLEGGWLHVKIHKTHKVDDLPITLELDAALREWLIHYQDVLGRPLEPGMFIVPAKDNSTWGAGPREFTYRPFDQITRPDNIYRRAVDAADLPFTRGNGFHTLRRSFARIFYEELKRRGHPDPIRPVQAMLHHATPEMTYLYIGVELDREARNEVLRGQMFLSRLAVDTTNVTQLRRADGSAPTV